MSNVKFILFSILFLALTLRVYKIGEVPLSLNRDEVGLGYDAYSLLITGRDQFGKFLPLTLRSSDDYKPASYAYFTAPYIAIFGPNEIAVRLPSAILGTLTVLVTYFLVRELFFSTYRSVLPLLTSFFVAVSPWHIQFSRAAFEANVSLFLLVSGVAFFLRGIRIGGYNFFISGCYLGLSLLTYHAARFMAPFLLVLLVLLHHKKLKKRKKELMFLFAAFFLFTFLSLPAIVSEESQIRLRVLSIFNNPEHQKQSAEAILVDQKLSAPVSGRLVHNRRLTPLYLQSLQQLVQNYIRHFDPQVLIFGVDQPRLQSHHAPSVGVIYSWEALLSLIGIFFLLYSRNKNTLILISWFMFGFLPASITWDIPSFLRSILVLPTIQIFSGLGVIELGKKLAYQSRLFALLGALFIFPWLLFSLATFTHQYFVHLNYETAENWRYGRHEAALLSEEIKDQYRKIVVSTNLDDPHLFFLFSLRYDPKKYLAEGGTVRGGWTASENRFDKFEFRPLPTKETFAQQAEPDVLYLGLADEISPEALVIATIYYPDNKAAIKLVRKIQR